VAELTAALAAGPGESGLEVHYQGIVAVGSGQLVGVEALARWEHPTLGAQSPARFVPLAEDHGLIDVLGRRVLDQACRDLAELHRQTGHRLLLTVNVSGHQLCDPDFPGDVRSALTAAGWPAASLVLEVTESLVEADSAAAVAALTALRDTGVSVAIDDFGTGFSSLARLDTLPADYLKLDDSFTAALTTSTRRARLMRSIVGMAEALDLQVIAEGVETPEQAERLRALGCRYAQGFLFHRPSPVAGLRELLREGAQTSTGPPLRQ
jgi:EAL domain-containing protein (putative c-di-GMP-specific phosphodiesterase class I)